MSEQPAPKPLTPIQRIPLAPSESIGLYSRNRITSCMQRHGLLVEYRNNTIVFAHDGSIEAYDLEIEFKAMIEACPVRLESLSEVYTYLFPHERWIVQHLSVNGITRGLTRIILIDVRRTNVTEFMKEIYEHLMVKS